MKLNKFILTTAMITGTVFLITSFSGCTQMNSTLAKYDRSNGYLKSENYMAKRIEVPGDLDNTNIEDYYVIPTIANQGDPKVPNLQPPETKVVLTNKTNEEDAV